MNAPFQIHPRLGAVQLDGLGPIAPSLERRRLQCYLALIICDIVSLFAGFAISGQLYLGAKGVTQGLAMVYLLLPIFLTIAIYNSTYSIDTLISAWRGMVRAVTALAIAGATIVFIAFYTKSSTYFSRVAFTLAMILSACLLLSMRLALRRLVTWRCGRKALNELVIDDGGPPVDLPGALRISAADFDLVPDLGDPHANDRIGLVLRNIDRVVVTCPPERRAVWAMTLKGANILGEVIDDAVIELGAQGARVAGGQGWLLVSSGPLGMRQRITKRLLDVSLSVTALVLLSPVLLLVALAILIEDGRPVFFVQQRLGRGNRFFNMYKFRSMTDGHCDRDGTISTSREDRRITRVGRFIRATSIDELPQLLNVIRGTMSLVGPRPHAIGSQAGDKLFWEVDLRYWQRHALKPGLSGLAQVRGLRGATDREADLAHRLQADLEYLENWSIGRDIKIIFMTLRVLAHERAF